jgi:hypothetical protein
MDSNLLLVLTIFIAVTTIAMVAQAVAMLGIARVAKQTQQKIDGLLPEVSKILETTNRAVEQTGKFVSDANVRTAEILDSTKLQLVKVDELLKEVTGRARAQMDRAEIVLDDAMTRTQSTVAAVQRGVVSPIREVHGFFTGVRTAISHIGRSNRPTVDHATSDEEMFI